MHDPYRVVASLLAEAMHECPLSPLDFAVATAFLAHLPIPPDQASDQLLTMTTAARAAIDDVRKRP